MERLRYPIDVVLDTDAFNEIDDQFAIAYLLRSEEDVCTKALYAAPFLNEKSASPGDGMEKSFDEIHHILALEHDPPRAVPVFRGAKSFMRDEDTPVISEAALDIAERAMSYSAEHPLYVVGIAAATDIASAILLNPNIISRIVVVWLGGSSMEEPDREEFNYIEDPVAADILFESGVPLVHVPCWGVAEHFSIGKDELSAALLGRNPLCDYLASHTIEECEQWWPGEPWEKTIWDVTAVAYLVNKDGRFLRSRMSGRTEYVYEVHRDELFRDLFEKLART